MSRVVFLIDFTIEGKAELASLARILKAKTLKIDGLTSSGEDDNPLFRPKLRRSPADEAPS